MKGNEEGEETGRQAIEAAGLMELCQGVLGLSEDEIQDFFTKATSKADTAFNRVKAKLAAEEHTKIRGILLRKAMFEQIQPHMVQLTQPKIFSRYSLADKVVGAAVNVTVLTVVAAGVVAIASRKNRMTVGADAANPFSTSDVKFSATARPAGKRNESATAHH